MQNNNLKATKINELVKFRRHIQEKNLVQVGQEVPAQSGELSEYTKQTRAGQLTKTVQKNPNVELTKKSQQTFDEYSKKYMGKGE